MNVLNSSHIQEVAFVRILVPFSLGIMSFYTTTYSASPFTCLVLINFLLFGYLYIRHISITNAIRKRTKGLNGLIFNLLLFFTGALSCALYKQHNNTDYYIFKKSNYIKISISEEPENRQNIILFTANVTQSFKKKHPYKPGKGLYYTSSKVSGKIRVTLFKNTTDSIGLKYGDDLIIPSKFTETPPPLNPSEFNFKQWLALKNIYHQTFLNQDEIVKLETKSGNKLLALAMQMRKNQVGTYRKLIKDEDAFAVASTLILGYRADLSSEILDIYSKTGTIHALSVSGMHVGLLYLILNQALWFLNKRRGMQFLKIVLILFIIWFYTLITGYAPSALRASIMISIFIVAKLFRKQTNSYNILAFTAFLLLLYNPFLIWDVGFQLSFMAVLGLIYLQPKIQGYFAIKQLWLAKIWEITAISLAAQLATYPLSVYYFHQFPIYFIISNLFITLPVTLIMYIGILIALFKLDSLGPLLEWLIIFTNSGLTQITKLPGSGISAIWLSKTEFILLSVSLTLFVIACAELKKKLLIYSLIVFLGLQGMISYHKIQAYHQKKIIQFTLKKNYAIAAIFAQQALLFTDLDQESKVFKYSVKPALDQHRITEVIFVALN